MVKTKTATKSKKKVGQKPPTKDLRSRLIGMIEVIEKTWFQVSVFLAEIYDSDRFKSWGFEKFEDYTVKDLNMEYRTAMWRVSMGRAIKNLGITEDQVSGLGWTKFKELSILINDGMTKKDFDKILSKIKGMNHKDIADFVRKERNVNAGKEDKVKKVTLKFSLTGEQADVIESGLDKAKGLAGTEEASIALEYIVMQWFISAEEKVEDIGDVVSPSLPVEQEAEQKPPVKKAPAKKKSKKPAKKVKKSK